MRTVFCSLTAIAEKKGKCGCGIVRRRSQRFNQTVNPYNKNPDGSIKSADDIRKELERHRAAWMEAPIHCVTCKPRARVGTNPPQANADE